MTDQEPSSAPSWPRGVRIYVVVVTLLGVVGLVLSGIFGPSPEPVALTTLLALGLLGVVVREPDVGSKVTFSFLSIVMTASLVLVGPLGSGLLGAVSSGLERGRRPLVARMFNAGMTAVLGVVGGVVYVRVGGLTDLTGVAGAGELLIRVALPLMVADIAQMLVNALLLAGVVRLSSGVPPRRFIVQIVSSSGPAYIGYGIIGFLLVVLWLPADVGPFSAVLILAPLFVARWAFVQYGDEQRSHERTLNALVTAVETKDPYAAGHSARVARLAEWMAEPLSMKAQDVESLKFAAMLHDVGKVGVPTRILRRPKTFSPADIAALTAHSEDGVDLVRDIDFLAGSLDGIRHHHERWDGLGYPAGLSGTQIPLASRIIAAADAFDALTTERAERPAYPPGEALRELEARSGEQLDPTVVDALATVLERHPWPVTEASPERLAAMRGYLDHDDPFAWDAVVGDRPPQTGRPSSPPLTAPAQAPTRAPAPNAVSAHPARTSHPVEEEPAGLTGGGREQVGHEARS